MKEALLYGHLGLGDHLICNALVRELAKTRRVIVLCKHHNAASVAFMFRDSTAIEVFGIKDDAEAKEATEMISKHGIEVVRLGMHTKEKWDISKWDESFFGQAGVPFQQRWNGFKVDRQPSRELALTKNGDGNLHATFDPVPTPPKGNYAFVHDDVTRGFQIDRSLVRKGRPMISPVLIKPTNGGEPNIFDWWGIIEGAGEIHCIDSSFLCLIDSLPCLKAKKYVLHLYATFQQKPTGPPKLAKPWEILK